MSDPDEQLDPSTRARLERLEELAMHADRQAEEFNAQLIDLHRRIDELATRLRLLEHRLESVSEADEPGTTE